MSAGARSRLMSRIRGRDTGPEVSLRRHLREVGLGRRYRVGRRVAGTRPDVCSPASNRGYWVPPPPQAPQERRQGQEIRSLPPSRGLARPALLGARRPGRSTRLRPGRRPGGPGSRSSGAALSPSLAQVRHGARRGIEPSRINVAIPESALHSDQDRDDRGVRCPVLPADPFAINWASRLRAIEPPVCRLSRARGAPAPGR